MGGHPCSIIIRVTAILQCLLQVSRATVKASAADMSSSCTTDLRRPNAAGLRQLCQEIIHLSNNLCLI